MAMFDFFRNLFRYKAKSVKEFVEAVKKEGCCKTVIATVAYGTQTRTFVDITDFQYVQYILELTATTPCGWKIVCRERFQRFTTADVEDAKLFLLGEQRVKELQEALPGVSVDLIGPNGRPMDDEMYAKLHQDVAIHNVSV
ncbi:hypothetical protein KKA93_00245 [Patescibacteria group bacterium]|nr:hypothetical protein [Patescibacteria group bacterium]MBU1933923.1 hypothetical protein [Patescibacteria group bacterium]MBU2233337.1 hypothetical protein [Patescibacteria group bacterium]MBU2264494.1 hypothetical protein [Patescibacteria group bacterium]